MGFQKQYPQGSGGGLPIGAHIGIEQGASAPPGFIARGEAQTLLQSAYPDLFSQIGIKADAAPTGTWTKNTSIVTGSVLNSVAYGNGYYVAVGDNSKIFYATDPTGTWTENTDKSATSNQAVEYVAYDEVSGYWIANVNGTSIWYTTDPTGVWNAMSGYTSTSFTKWVRFGEYLVWVRYNASAASLYYTTSPDIAPTQLSFSGVSSAGAASLETNGSQLVVCGFDGRILVSTNLLTGWADVTTGTSSNDWGIVQYAHGQWFVLGQSSYATAADPFGTWTVGTTSGMYVNGQTNVNSALFDQDAGYWLHAYIQDALINPDIRTSAMSSYALGTTAGGVAITPSHWIIVGNSGSLWTQPRQSYNPATQFYLPTRQHTNDGLQLAIKAE